MLALLLFAPLLAGCGATTSDIFSSDLLSKDAEWFSRSGRLFIKNVSIDTPPLTPDRPVTAEDLVSADGVCPGMASANAPTNANALSDGTAAPAPAPTGTVALGHTECDVVRGVGAPDNRQHLQESARRSRRGGQFLARRARRYLHLHRRAADLGRARG